jgi:hypothetical protein
MGRRQIMSISRANNYIKLYEGFKLGSLGANKKLKSIEPPVTRKKTEVSNFHEATALTWTWTETLTSAWRSFFSSKIREQGGRLYIMLIARAVPKLGIYFENRDGRRTLIAEYNHTTIHFDTREEQQDWKEKIQREVENFGLFGLNFPHNWALK